jgi:hypothetical protein
MFPPAGGFWELGGFEGENLWISGSNLAPFDQRVNTTKSSKENIGKYLL